MTRRIELSEDEFNQLLFVLGQATGMAVRHSDNGLALDILRLANAINRDNPNWKPYAIPEAADDREKLSQPTQD